MMKPYLVRILRGTQTVRQFEALASDSCACVAEHADKCAAGEKLDVMSLEMWKRFEADRAHEQRQWARIQEMEQRQYSIRHGVTA